MSRYRTVLLQQVALLDGSLRESVSRLRALAAALQQSAQVEYMYVCMYVSIYLSIYIHSANLFVDI